MTYILYGCILLLAIASVLNTRRIRKLEEMVADLRKAHWTHVYATNAIQRKLDESIEARDRLAMRVSDLEVAVEVNTAKFEERIGKDVADVTEFCERRIDSLVEDIRALQLWKIEASELIEAHAELEKEAANSERMFQEGLSNLLNYGVGKE
jgi:hypothetical protein